MSFTSEHRRLQPVLDKARRLDIASEPAPNALFEALSAGFNLWCTPDDHPDGWDDIPMDAGAFAKPCEYVANATWGWTDEQITHVELDSEAYALRDRVKPGSHRERLSFRNRPEDVAWAAAKVAWLFSLVAIACPPIRVASDVPTNRMSDGTLKPADGILSCPHCGSRLNMTEVYFEKRLRILLTCENVGSCNFREL